MYKTIIGAAAATGVRCMSHIEVEEWQKINVEGLGTIIT